MSDFQDLLHDAEQLTAQIDKENSTSLPRLQRTLSQLFEANKRKLAKTSNYMSSESNEINASILLAGKGIDAPKLTHNIENLNIPATLLAAQQQQQQKLPDSSAAAAAVFSPFDKFSSMEQFRDIDLQAFLRSEKEEALMTIIDETRRKTVQEIEDSFMTSNELEWDKQKQWIMNELLGSFNPDASATASSLTTTTTTTTTALNRTVAANARTQMTDVEVEFARQVFNYNQRVLSNEQLQQQRSSALAADKPDLLAGFASLLQQQLNDKNLDEAWSILSFMSSAGDSNNARNKTDYETSDEAYRTCLDRDSSTDMQAGFVRAAQAYLEQSFRALIQQTVHANLKQAKLGGSLGTLSLVSGYLRLSQSEKYHQFSSGEEVFDDKQPLWPTIYLCLRCGDVDAARQVAAKTRKDDVVAYLDEIVRNKATNSTMSAATENKLKLEYKSIIR
jgi:nuclear pore complex protein Nup93